MPDEQDRKLKPEEAMKEMAGVLAKACAQHVAAYPPEVQIMTAQVFMEALIVVHVLPTKRVEFASRVGREIIQQVRENGAKR